MTKEEFQTFEKQAWDGILDFNSFPAAEYKYFDTIQELGRRHRQDFYPLDFCRQDIRKARKIYDTESKKTALGAQIYRKYHDAIMRSSELRCKIHKTASVEDKLVMALECIELLTGEEGFARRAYEKSTETTM